MASYKGTQMSNRTVWRINFWYNDWHKKKTWHSNETYIFRISLQLTFSSGTTRARNSPGLDLDGLGQLWEIQEDHYFIYDFVDKQNQTLDWTPSKGLDFPLHHLVCHNVNQVHHNVTMSPCQSRWSYVPMSIKLIPCSFNLASISNLVCNISPLCPTGVPLNLCVSQESWPLLSW